MSNLEPTTDPVITHQELPGAAGGDAAPVTPVVDTTAALAEMPDDFGAEVIAQFERRTFGSGGAAMASDGEVPGGVSISAESAADPVGDDPNAPPGGWPDVQSRELPKPAADEIDETDAAAVAAAAGEGDATAPGAAPSDDAAAGVDSPSAPASGYTWTFEDPATGEARSAQFDDGDVQRALQLAAWAERLTPDLRSAMGAVEAGQAVAIPRADFDQFVAWRNQQQSQARDADLDNLDADPAVIQLLKQQRDELAALKGQQAPAFEQPAPGVERGGAPVVHANLDAAAQGMDAAISEYATAYRLEPQEIDGLLQRVVQSNVVARFQQDLSTFNPVTGALLQPADPKAVMSSALRYIVAQDPQLATALLARQQQPAVPTAPPAPASTSPLASAGAAPAAAAVAPQSPAPSTGAAADPASSVKRARAASLTSARSAATAPAPRGQKSSADYFNGMVSELADAMGVPVQ